MISVDPIRDEQKIQTMKSYLKGKSLRDHALFVVGMIIPRSQDHQYPYRVHQANR